MPLAIRYKADIVLQTNSLTVMCATDTMDGRVNSLYRNQYSQVLFNRTYFAEIYPMDKKADSGQALKTFVV